MTIERIHADIVDLLSARRDDITLKIKEENYRKFVEETSRKREDWIKSISDSAVVIMERQRYLMGMSKQVLSKCDAIS